MFRISKRYIIIAAVLAVIIIVLSVLTGSNRLQTVQSGPYRPVFSGNQPINQVALDKTSEQAVKSLPGLSYHTPLRQGGNLYYIKRAQDIPADKVITKNGVVVYKEITAPQLLQADIPTAVDGYIQMFGQPDATFYNSRMYGAGVMHLVYSSKGFTVRAYRYTGDIHDLQLYDPMPVENYIQQFGSDIYYSQNQVPKQQGD